MSISFDYKNTYEGYNLEIQIVDHCNLNCLSCNHFSPLSKPYFIPIEDYKNNLLLVKEKLPTIQYLMLVGGEPLLHPQLLNLCQITREIFPKLDVSILTNGIILNTWKKEDYENYKKLNIHFFISKYCNIDYSNIDYLRDSFQDIREIIGTKSVSRLLFESNLVDINGFQDQDFNFKHCYKYKLPCFTLKDKKIYICPFSAHIEHFCKKFNLNNIPYDQEENYLDLTQDINLQDLQNFCLKSKPICSYCKYESNIHSWDKSTFSLDEYTKNDKELFLTNYNLYNKKFNNILYKNTIDTNLYNLIDPNFSKEYNNKLIKRFKTGIIDIIIPFYKIQQNKLLKCYKSLCDQTIIDKCNIYLISDNSPDEEYVFNLFNTNKKLNTYFFKTEKNLGPGAAKNLGIKNSYSPYLFFLDSDDYFILNDNLEQLYSLTLQNPEGNIFKGLDYIESLNITKHFHNNLYQRNFLESSNILFGPLFINEDSYFHSLLDRHPDCKIIINNNICGYFYSQNNDNSINKNTQELVYAVLCEKILVAIKLYELGYNFITYENTLRDFFWGVYIFEQTNENTVDEEIKNYLLFLVFLSYILLKIPYINFYFFNILKDNEISNYLKQQLLILKENEIIKKNFLSQMESEFYENEDFNKILPEGKKIILNFLKKE